MPSRRRRLVNSSPLQQQAAERGQSRTPLLFFGQRERQRKRERERKREKDKERDRERQ